jgi:hypothetical protein
MSELSLYYENFCAGWWAEEDEDKCPCHGGGWALSDVDTWHKCPIHYRGQPCREDSDGFESADAYVAYYNACLVNWAVEHKLAEYTREETARRSAERAEALHNAPPVAFVEDDSDIPF